MLPTFLKQTIGPTSVVARDKVDFARNGVVSEGLSDVSGSGVSHRFELWYEENRIVSASLVLNLEFYQTYKSIDDDNLIFVLEL